MKNRRKIHIGLILTLTAIVANLTANLFPVLAEKEEEHQVTLCHATHSETNPYNIITVDFDSVFKQGHDQHQDQEDIIPPFDYGDGLHYPGLNWNAQGQAILNNGCNLPSPTSVPTTEPTPTTVSPTTDPVDPTLTPTVTVGTTDPVDPTTTLTVTPTITVGITDPVDPTITLTPTQTQLPTQTQTPTQTLTPTPTNSSSTNSDNSNNNSNSSNNNSNSSSSSTPTTSLRRYRSNPVVAGVVQSTSRQILGTADNFNPLVSGLKLSFGGEVLGATTELAQTAEVVNNSEKLPTSNIVDPGHTLTIPALNINEPVYFGQKIGDNYIIGHHEILLDTSLSAALYYAHNGKGLFNHLSKLTVGDEIIDTRVDQSLVYQVTSVKTIKSTDVKAIKSSDDTIYLMTCVALGSPDRVLVTATLKDHE